MKRAFIYSDEKSNKFWTIETEESNITITFGEEEDATGECKAILKDLPPPVTNIALCEDALRVFSSGN
ncbi:MAG: hypothetical protein LBQ88_03995 [Treponema sp.]|jgi:hypothetical protein|nr:hypothetical protein [Treponema sp.]